MNKDVGYVVSFSKINGLGAVRLYNIYKYFGSMETAWNAPIEEFKSIGIFGENLIEQIRTSRKLINPEKEISELENNQIKVLTLVDKEYPEILKQISNPPFILYYKGNYKKNIFDRCLSVIGSRKATSYGLKISVELSERLAEQGITIVSGMASGIDSGAHAGALKSKHGKTIAILGCGVDIVYPSENKRLYSEIVERGLVMSEYPPKTQPAPGLFPPRNRIISGLSVGTVIVEAGEKSGTLITADLAIEQGREVFAIPGLITNPLSKGVHNLIKQGATLVSELSDITNCFNWDTQLSLLDTKLHEDNKPHIKNLNLTDIEKEVYLVINENEQHLDDILSKLSLSYSEVLMSISMLEIKNLIKQLPGKLFVKS